MERRHFGWLGGVIAVGLMLMVGLLAYNIGVSHGLAQSAAVAAGGQGVPPFAPWRHGLWGPGFGVGFIFPLLFLFFWVAILKRLFWGGGWHHYRRYGGVPPAFEEWHRRMHAQPGGPNGPDTKG
jgi:hypothetical protein